MFGLGRNVTLALVGWLWADILLGLFVIFLAAASAPISADTKAGPSIDPTPIELSVPVDGARLLGDDEAAIDAEQAKFAKGVTDHLSALGDTRRVALVFAYGSHGQPAEGERLASVATAGLETTSRFAEAVMKNLHDIVPGDAGTSVALEIYLYR